MKKIIQYLIFHKILSLIEESPILINILTRCIHTIMTSNHSFYDYKLQFHDIVSDILELFNCCKNKFLIIEIVDRSEGSNLFMFPFLL